MNIQQIAGDGAIACRGEGSIFQRADGLWGCAVSNGTGKDGKRRRKVLVGKTKLEVQQKLAKMQQRAPLPDSIDPGKLTMSQYLNQWLKTDAKQRCRERSLENHERAIRCEIEPRMGRVPLAKLSVQHILAR